MFSISTGLAGVGLPETIYMDIAKRLYEIDNSIICPSGVGNICHSETFCGTMIDSLEGIHLKVIVDDLNSFELPTSAIMRQRDSNTS